jgi:tetratricopeptide (TPR) repeat protein
MVNSSALSEALELADQCRQSNRCNQAEQIYREILEKHPCQSDALYGMGILAQQRKQYKAAEEFFRTLLQIQPNSVKAFFSLATLYQLQGTLLEAEVAYRQVMALHPKNAPIYNNLGYVLEQQNKLDEAIAFYQKALELQPNCDEAKANLGNALHTQGKLSPEQQVYYADRDVQLGLSRHQTGDLQTAVAYYQQAIALNPEFWQAHYNLGIAMQEQGLWKEAIDCHQKALELNQDFIPAYDNLGQIYQVQNQFEKATVAYQRAVNLFKSRAQASEIGQGNAQEVFKKNQLDSLRNEIQARSQTHIVLACMPKTASTFIMNAIALATGFKPWPLVFDYDRNEQDIYWPRLFRSVQHNTVTHQHIRATRSNLACMKALGIKPIIQVRNLAGERVIIQ